MIHIYLHIKGDLKFPQLCWAEMGSGRNVCTNFHVDLKVPYIFHVVFVRMFYENGPYHSITKKVQ